ncbi:glycosyltransferase family 9 protein [Muriicola soli]|uniref:Lipopolysaccharide heptosyltransferase family protein n=1 Tax=Muriicola soli TaxID=2507538 RepID=A0A411EDI3_9FLAO|nr:glycosyltransferase family 9 protein [Muriicola soli]QBA65677.1 lipopolysaccharide heptosyltransferase family protein [Muriicola soli]
MGDVAMTVPVLLALIRENPNLKLLVLTRPFFAPIFEKVPNTYVFIADLKNKHKGLLGIYRLAAELKKLRLRGVADLHNVLRTKLLKLFFTGKRVPFIQINKGRREKRIITSWRNKELSPLKSTHERYADVFRALGYTITLNREDVLKTCDPTKAVNSFLNSKNKKLIGIAPFAAFTGKMYPINLMEKVLEKLNNTDKYKIILFGGGKEEAMSLRYMAEKYTNCFEAIGKLSFSDEICLISHLKLMVSMDSGNGHLSAMYGIPTVTIWGITHPCVGFAPFGQPMRNSIVADRGKYPMIPTSVYGNKYPKGYEKVMESIDPQMVYSKIEAVLKE